MRQSPLTSDPSLCHKRAIRFIFITVLLDIMALGMTAPVLPVLVGQFVAHNVSETAVIYGAFNALFALMQFLCAPVIGCLSDQFGRRPMILASNIGLGLSYLTMAFAPNLAWFFFGRIISGVTGASFAIACSYVTDVTPEDKRGVAFGTLGAAFGLGLVFGPGIGGFLGVYGAKLPLYFAAVFSLANTVYGLFILPESLPRSLRSRFRWKKANPIAALGLLWRHPELTTLSSLYFISTLAQVSLPSTLILYASYRFGWNSGTLGLSLTTVGLVLVLAQVLVIPKLIKYLGNRRSIVTGLLCGGLGMTLAGFAPVDWVLWLAIPVLSLWGLFGAAAQAIMTRHVSAIEQGQLQGANASLSGIAEFFGPLIFPLIFAWFVRPNRPDFFQSKVFAGAPFILAAVLLIISAAIAFFATQKEDDKTRSSGLE